MEDNQQAIKGNGEKRDQGQRQKKVNFVQFYPALTDNKFQTMVIKSVLEM